MTGRRPVRRPARRRAARPETPDLLRWVETACADRKAVDGVVLDLRRLSDAADFFVVVSGTSDTHVRAIAEHVVEELRGHGVKAHHVEGLTGGRWVLLDFVDLVVHVFHPALREFYQLEGLWSDAPLRAVPTGEERR